MKITNLKELKGEKSTKTNKFYEIRDVNTRDNHPDWVKVIKLSNNNNNSLSNRELLVDITDEISVNMLLDELNKFYGFNIEYKPLKKIKSLDELEGVRIGLCKKYNTEFYITNEGGRYRIVWDCKLAQAVGVVSNGSINLTHLGDNKNMFYETIVNDIKDGTIVYLNYKGDLSYGNLIVDLEEEGFEW